MSYLYPEDLRIVLKAFMLKVSTLISIWSMFKEKLAYVFLSFFLIQNFLNWHINKNLKGCLFKIIIIKIIKQISGHLGLSLIQYIWGSPRNSCFYQVILIRFWETQLRAGKPRKTPQLTVCIAKTDIKYSLVVENRIPDHEDKV